MWLTRKYFFFFSMRTWTLTKLRTLVKLTWRPGVDADWLWALRTLYPTVITGGSIQTWQPVNFICRYFTGLIPNRSLLRFQTVRGLWRCRAGIIRTRTKKYVTVVFFIMFVLRRQLFFCRKGSQLLLDISIRSIICWPRILLAFHLFKITWN